MSRSLQSSFRFRAYLDRMTSWVAPGTMAAARPSTTGDTNMDVQPAASTAPSKPGIIPPFREHRTFDEIEHTLIANFGKGDKVIDIATESVRTAGDLRIDRTAFFKAIDAAGNNDGKVTADEIDKMLTRFDTAKKITVSAAGSLPPVPTSGDRVLTGPELAAYRDYRDSLSKVTKGGSTTPPSDTPVKAGDFVATYSPGGYDKAPLQRVTVDKVVGAFFDEKAAIRLAHAYSKLNGSSVAVIKADPVPPPTMNPDPSHPFPTPDVRPRFTVVVLSPSIDPADAKRLQDAPNKGLSYFSHIDYLIKGDTEVPRPFMLD